MYTIGKIPIATILILFVAYVIGHTIIGYSLKSKKKEAEDNPTQENIRMVKTLKHSFNWFPAAYVTLLLIYFYFFV